MRSGSHIHGGGISGGLGQISGVVSKLGRELASGGLGDLKGLSKMLTEKLGANGGLSAGKILERLGIKGRTHGQGAANEASGSMQTMEDFLNHASPAALAQGGFSRPNVTVSSSGNYDLNNGFR